MVIHPNRIILRLGVCLALFASAVSVIAQKRSSEVKLIDSGVEIKILHKPDTPTLKLARLNNPISGVFLKTDSETIEIQVKPQPEFWEILLPQDVALKGATVLVETVGKPHIAGQPMLIEADQDGVVRLFAHLATTSGDTLRYEPQPHKNTLGFWTNPEDFPQWAFQVSQPGKYRVKIHQGCGKNQGGSQAEVRVGDQKIKFTVKETGHFQNFVAVDIGTIEVDSEDPQTLKVHILKLAKNAAMDLRLIELIPVGE